MKLKVQIITLILAVGTIAVYGQSTDYPYVISNGSANAAEVKDDTDTFKLWFNIGQVVNTQYVPALDGNYVLLGMPYVMYYTPAFKGDPYVSKGYFADYIELRWDIQRYEQYITKFKIYRKPLGSDEDSALVAIVPGDTRIWHDEYAAAGQLYEYTIFAEGISPFIKEYVNFVQGVGFRLPVGTVTGRITYQSGTAVEGVNVYAETEDNLATQSIYLNGMSDYMLINPEDDERFDFDTAFVFQAWLLPSSGNSGAVIFQRGNQYLITYSDGLVEFTAGGQSISLSFTPKQDTFFNVTAVRTSDSLKLYVIYFYDEYYKTSAAFSGSTPPSGDYILLGKDENNANFYHGIIDEVRLWNGPLSEEQILDYATRYLSGDEDFLVGYYRLNEGIGDHGYDLTHQAFTYYGVDMYVEGTWNDTVPLREQLAFRGRTDENGNYVISGIPYSTSGTNYEITPIYKTHLFDPTSKILYFAPGSNFYSDVNFVDKSSFPVKGNVVYKNTRFPVEGAQIYVDGRAVFDSRGLPVRTDMHGNFTVDVPIGWHYIEVRKDGHIFENNGRFPPDSNELYNFQEALTIQKPFVDKTLVKVIGRVAGGPIEAAKPDGLGKTKNNLGNATITLTTQKGYDLYDKDQDTSGTWRQLVWQNDSVADVGHTDFAIQGSYPKQIKIYPDPNTGEFVAWLLPEKYIVTDVRAGQYIFGDDFHIVMDLTNAFDSTTSIDSVIVDYVFDGNGMPQPVYRVDSVHYNAKYDFIYRVHPEIQVTNVSGDSVFWEREIQVNDSTVVQVVDEHGRPLTQYPIFRQLQSYYLMIKVFERYVNVDRDNAEDIVPVTDGYVEIQNDLAIQTLPKKYKLNSNGIVYYRFKGGLPNITTGGLGDYVKTMSVTAFTGPNYSIQTQWLPGGEPFKAYVLGAMPVGNSFVSVGPLHVLDILRDPPGSNSYSYLEKNTTISVTEEFERIRTLEEGADVEIYYGTKIQTQQNAGPIGIISEIEDINNVTLGVTGAEEWVRANTLTTTVTTTQRWETGSSEDFVGADADLFIGITRNIIYGLAVAVTLIDNDTCSTCVDDNLPGYSIGTRNALSFTLSDSTYFMYSKGYIRDYLIPNLEFLRNQILLNNPYYTSLVPEDDPNFGLDGYYEFNPPSDTLTDSVFEYNQMIENWKDLLADNERDKAQADSVLRNIAFSAGSSYEYTYQVDTQNVHVKGFNFYITGFIAKQLGLRVNKTGVIAHGSISKTYNRNHTTTNDTTRTTARGFVLSDPDEGDFISLQVKESPMGFSPIFFVQGGQTQCPYEGANISEFYAPGTVLSQATIPRQVPQIQAENPNITNVPEDQDAIFTISLANASMAINNDQWLLLRVDETSNQNGAAILLDGTPIGNGRLIYLPQNQAITKTISIRKVRPEVYDYENIGIILSSPCQVEDIADTVLLSAHFIPICTHVELSSPVDQWVINTNTGDTLPIVIQGYDLNHSRFEKVLFQYKPSSSSQWITQAQFYVHSDEVPPDDPTAFPIDNQPSIDYAFDMHSLPDRKYDIRAISVCYDNTKNPSEILHGTKDTERPKVFGTPQPADGILSPGEDIMITFNEPIQQSLLTPYNFSLKAVLNQSELTHGAAIAFDGVDDYLTVLSPVDLTQSPFTVEFWLKRTATGEQTVFNQGDIEIGFDEQNQLFVRLGDEQYVSSVAQTDTMSWHHYAVSFDYDNHLLSAYVDDQILLDNEHVNQAPNGAGRMYIGKNSLDQAYLKGYLHDLRVWLKARTFGQVYSNMYKRLTGSEVGLVGLWPMDEAIGDKAKDIVRNHHAMLYGATWRVFPSGYSIALSDQKHVDFRLTPDITITPESDFTIEFWFKAEQPQNAIIFSNGTVGNPLPDTSDVINIGVDSTGAVFVQNNLITLTANDQNYCDGNWHHLAFAVMRQGNAYLYIDGEMKTYTPARSLGGLAGVYATLGARRYNHTDTTYFSDFFTGKIDEFRIWNSYRNAELIKLYINTKLQPDQTGLLSYFPFDAYDEYMILRPTLQDQVTGRTAIGPNDIFDHDDQPNIKDVKPLQNLAFEWVSNENQIVFNIKEDPALIEKTVVEISVKNVEDLYENRMASPVSWTAFINQNPVVWSENYLRFEKKVGEPLTFQVNILNKSGVEQNYQILNLPQWLQVDAPEGILEPNSQKTLTFSVEPYVNIGYHEVNIYLTSGFGYNEKLAIDLKVYQTPPDWNVDPEQYEYSMGIVARVKIDGRFSTNPDDMVGAFINGQCRGVAHIQYIPEYDTYLCFLNIYSNNRNGETVTFKIWDASAGMIHQNVMPQVQFQNNNVLGTPSQPIVLETYNSYTRVYPLANGWTWFSVNLQSPTLNNLDSALASLNPKPGDVIKGQTAFATYSANYGWSGSLNALDNLHMFMIKSQNPDTLTISGAKVAPLQLQIPIRTGWNWIAYSPQVYMTVNDAFANYNPANGDIIKSQYNFAVYDSIMGWIGSLKYLEPGKGYMYKTANPDGYLIFPESGVYKAKPQTEIFRQFANWRLDPHQYPFTMSVIAKPIFLKQQPLDTCVIAALDKGQNCRALAKAQKLPQLGQLYFITIHGNNADTLEFYASDGQNLWKATQTISFKPNEPIGTLQEPLLLQFEPISPEPIIKVYPNPFKDYAYISLNLQQDQNIRLEVSDLTGRLITVLFDGKLQAGKHTFKWSGTTKAIASGVYMVRLITEKQTFTKTIVKQ